MIGPGRGSLQGVPLHGKFGRVRGRSCYPRGTALLVMI